jgi:hypothetical protein
MRRKVTIACQALFFLLAVTVLFLLVSFASNSSVEAEANHLFDQLKSKLPPGWSATRTKTGVIVHREKPLNLYNPISLYSHEDDYLETVKRPHDYSLTLICKPIISSQELKKLETENAKTDDEIRGMEEKTQNFWGKSGYKPRTPEQKKLYEDYKVKLRTLPYNVLPDGRFDESLVYVESSIPHGYVMFYDTRDKYDCLSAISVILSIIEPMEHSTLRYNRDEKPASDILWGKRLWEAHNRRKEIAH